MEGGVAWHFEIGRYWDSLLILGGVFGLGLLGFCAPGPVGLSWLDLVFRKEDLERWLIRKPDTSVLKTVFGPLEVTDRRYRPRRGVEVSKVDSLGDPERN